MMQRLIALWILFRVVLPVLGATNVPTSLYCLSLRFQSATDKPPFGATYTMEFSSVDTNTPNGELMPVWDPDVAYDHATMFLFSQSGSTTATMGDLYVNTPVGNDRNGNGFNDFFEISQEVAAVTTSGHYVDATGGEGDVIATWNRAANSRTGTCRLQFSGKISRTFTHNFELFQFSGALDYLAAGTNAFGTLKLNDMSSPASYLAGPVALIRTNADLVSLRPGSWTNNTGVSVSFQAVDTLQRSGSNYLGFVDFPETGDFITWMLVISDPNDANKNGVPDLSDILPAVVVPPILGLRLSTNQMVLSLIGQAGSRYQIETAASLGQTNWAPFQSILLTNNTLYLPLTRPTGAAAFWRARVQ